MKRLLPAPAQPHRYGAAMPITVIASEDPRLGQTVSFLASTKEQRQPARAATPSLSGQEIRRGCSCASAHARQDHHFTRSAPRSKNGEDQACV